MKDKCTELTLSKVAEWPRHFQIFAIIIICLLLFVVGYFFSFKNKIHDLKTAKTQESTLKQQLTQQLIKVNNLKRVEQQTGNTNKLFNDLLTQVTQTHSLPKFLNEVSNISKSNNLHLESVKILAEKSSGFYTKVPIMIVAYGNYHQLASFISSLANMKDIVTFEQLTIQRTKEKRTKQSADELRMELITAIYKTATIKQVKKT